MSSSINGFIYIIQEREFLRVFKIGRTASVLTRTALYPKGSMLMCVMGVQEPVRAEQEVLETLMESPLFKQRADVGRESFEVVQGHVYDELQAAVVHALKTSSSVTMHPHRVACS